MNTTTHLTPEIISEFEFEYDRQSNFLSYVKRSKVDIKIGDLIEKVEFSTISKGYGENRKHILQTNIESIFRDLINNGVKFNYDFIIDEYIIQRTKAIKLDIKKKTVKFKKDYKVWWAHQLNDININGVNFSYSSEKDFIYHKMERWQPQNPSITYKGITNEISFLDIPFTFRSDKKFTLHGSVTKNKRRNYSSIDNLSKKYIQLVEFKIASEKAASIAKENIRLEEEAKLKHLTDNFDNIIEKEEYKRV